MSTRGQNEKKFGQWHELPVGKRRYWLEVTGRLGWRARYWKEVDAQDTTWRFWQEIYDHGGDWWKSMRNFRWIRAIRKCNVPA